MNLVFIVIALAILFWFVALLYLKASIRRRTTPEYMLGQLREEIHLLEAGIDEKTEQNLLLLEEKIRALRDVCGEAERRVALYTRELQRKAIQDTALDALHTGPPDGRADAHSSAAAASGKGRRPSRRKSSAGPSRKGSILDSLEMVELNLARAAGAYKTQSVMPEAGRDKPPGKSRQPWPRLLTLPHLPPPRRKKRSPAPPVLSARTILLLPGQPPCGNVWRNSTKRAFPRNLSPAAWE